ncbi:hypothetical protein [Nocardia brasiliensis]|uniref:hypothetical protein n=1 Tax=Nocardia brasiliensis TaxID=37326 RepID=UPI0009DE9736|nr:hypothetical protein [Nocardia brasiliensis]
MNVGDSVRHSLDAWGRAEWDAAMLHACNAVDGTGKKRYPALGVAARFKQMVRDNLEILNMIGIPGVDLAKTRFPIAVESHLPDKRPDIADVIYGIHRCCHGHGEDLPDGFELTPPGGGTDDPRLSILEADEGELRLPAFTALGLVAIAVFAPENKGQQIPAGYYLSLFDRTFTIVDWWGWGDHFLEIASTFNLVRVEMDWTDWWDTWTPIRRTNP